LPSETYDLPFLSEQAKRNILGLNAARIFGLDPTPRKGAVVARLVAARQRAGEPIKRDASIGLTILQLRVFS
jgi:hypothetical protein